MNEQEIENFIRVRNYSIETIEYTWASSKEKIVSLINQMNPSDPDKIKNLLTTVDDFEEIINEMIYEKEYGVDEIPNEKTLLTHEKDLFLSKLNSLKEWYVDFLSLLISADSEYDEVEAPGKLWKEYEELNYSFRYSNDPNYKLAKQEFKIHEWKVVNHFPIIFSYTNIFTEMSRMRDQVIHNTGAKAGRSGIPIKTDHILNNKMPGNSIIISNTITLFIYGYVELLETLENSMIVHSNGTPITSKSHKLFKVRY
jgi:hypothetical protein